MRADDPHALSGTAIRPAVRPAIPPAILVVDDDPRVLLAIEGCLQCDDFTVVTARCGADALRLLERPHEVIFALLDVVMPGMDGYELAREMRKRAGLAHIPICFLTANASDNNRELLAYSLGAVDFLRAPVDPPLLRAKVRAFIELWRSNRELARVNSQLSEEIVVRQRAEELLRRSERWLRRIIEAAPIGMMMMDMMGGISMVNAQAGKLFGYTEEELLGLHVGALFPSRFRIATPSEREALLRDPASWMSETGSDWRARAKTGARSQLGTTASVTDLTEGTRKDGSAVPVFQGAPIGQALEGTRKDGSAVPVEIGISSLETPEGPRFVVSIIDISERKKLDQLKHEFIATVSHELRSPVASIHGALGVFRDGLLEPNSEDGRSLMDLTYENAERLVRLVDDLLDIETVQAGRLELRFEQKTLRPMIEQALHGMGGYRAEREVKLSLQPGCDAVEVSVDPLRLRQVIDNLLSNAIKHSPPSGQVEIALRTEERADKTPWVRIEIKDHGPGISPEFAPRVFQKFAQDKSDYGRPTGGTGLGLAISKSLAEAMHGHLGFSTVRGSPTDSGSCFYLDLPLMTDSSAVGSTEPSSVSPPL